MGFTYYVPPKISSGGGNPYSDLISNALKRYSEAQQAEFLRPKLQEELLKAQQYNKYYGPNMESQMGLRGAQAGHLGAMTEAQQYENQYLPQKLQAEQQKRQFELENPLFGAAGSSGNIGRLLYLKKMLEEHPELANQDYDPKRNGPESFIPRSPFNPVDESLSPSHKQVSDIKKLLERSMKEAFEGKANKTYAPSALGKLQNEYREAQSGHYPGTDIPFESEQAKEEFLAPYREKLGGLKSGQHYIFDPKTHEKIGFETETTNEEKKVETGRGIFNGVMKYIRKGDEFSGKDSVRKFDRYASEYGKNPEATKKIDDLLVAEKLLSAGTVNEASTLGAGKQLQVFNSLKSSLSSMDIPQKILQYEKAFKLPKEANIKASLRAQQIINDVSKNSAENVPATKRHYYHPEKYLKHDEEKTSSKSENSKKDNHYTTSDIKATAEKYGISEEEVLKRLRGAKKK